MSDQVTAFGVMLEELALETVTLDSDDVQGMGHILNIVCAMEDGCSDWCCRKAPFFHLRFFPDISICIFVWFRRIKSHPVNLRQALESR